MAGKNWERMVPIRSYFPRSTIPGGSQGDDSSDTRSAPSHFPHLALALLFNVVYYVLTLDIPEPRLTGGMVRRGIFAPEFLFSSSLDGKAHLALVFGTLALIFWFIVSVHLDGRLGGVFRGPGMVFGFRRCQSWGECILVEIRRVIPMIELSRCSIASISCRSIPRYCMTSRPGEYLRYLYLWCLLGQHQTHLSEKALLYYCTKWLA